MTSEVVGGDEAEDGEEQRTMVAVLVELLRPIPTGEVLTYKAMGDALGLDPENVDDRRRMQMAFGRARRLHLRQERRAVENIPGEGYRVVLPNEHARVSEHIEDRGLQHFEFAWETVTYCRTSGLTNEEKALLDAKRRGLRAKLDAVARTEARNANRKRATEQIMDDDQDQ